MVKPFLWLDQLRCPSNQAMLWSWLWGGHSQPPSSGTAVLAERDPSLQAQPARCSFCLSHPKSKHREAWKSSETAFSCPCPVILPRQLENRWPQRSNSVIWGVLKHPEVQHGTSCLSHCREPQEPSRSTAWPQGKGLPIQPVDKQRFQFPGLPVWY